MHQPPLLSVGPGGLAWPHEQRGASVFAAIIVILLAVVVTLAAAVLDAPLAALGAAVFASYRLVAFIGSLPTAMSRWIIQVGPDGVWLPELGYRRWTDFSSVRVETYASPGDGVGPNRRPRPRRRLGFELREDAEPGTHRLAELEADIRLAWYRVASWAGGAAQRRPARYAIREASLGTPVFEAIVAAVADEIPLVEDEPVEGPEPDDLVALHEVVKDRRKRWAGWGVFALFLLIILGMVVFSKPIVVVVPVEVTPAPAVSPSGS